MKTLYRPVGSQEMKLILELDLKAFPPRLPEQPIFYPVLNQKYATQIARDWNTKDPFSGYVGFVTRFEVASPFINQYEEQIVGSKQHHELWIPSEDLDELNLNIVGHIQTIDAFYGEQYTGHDAKPRIPIFDNKGVDEQFLIWKNILDYNSMDFYCEIRAHKHAIYMNYRYWQQADFSQQGVTEQEKLDVLHTMKQYWEEHFPSQKPLLSR